MATDVTTNPQAIAREFAAAIRDEPAVEQLWLMRNRGSVDFNVVTNVTDVELERRIGDVFEDMVGRYGFVPAHLRFIGPNTFVEGTDVESLLSLYAQRIPLRPELESQELNHRSPSTTSATPESIAREFAAAIRDEPAVEQLWLVEDPGCLQLIAITSEVDDATELRIYDVFGDLIVRHPAAGIFPRLFSPGLFEDGTDMVSLVPQRARQIPLCD